MEEVILVIETFGTTLFPKVAVAGKSGTLEIDLMLGIVGHLHLPERVQDLLIENRVIRMQGSGDEILERVYLRVVTFSLSEEEEATGAGDEVTMML